MGLYREKTEPFEAVQFIDITSTPAIQKLVGNDCKLILRIDGNLEIKYGYNSIICKPNDFVLRSTFFPAATIRPDKMAEYYEPVDGGEVLYCPSCQAKFMAEKQKCQNWICPNCGTKYVEEK